MMLVEIPGYRIDNCTIKRGSRPSILIVSFVESSNLCILGIILLFLIWLLSIWVFGACRVLHDKPKFIKNRFHMKNLLLFWFWRFIASSSIERFYLSPFGFILPYWTMIFSIYYCRSLCYDSNEPKIIENGVRMQKICLFSFCSFCSFSVGRKFRPCSRKFRPPEVPAQAPEVPAHIFLPRILANSFWRFSLEGVRKFRG